MLAAAIAAHTAPPSFADPFDEDPQAFASDHNYTTGKQAIERKDWQRAAWYFDLAAHRYPENADIHNYLGYAYRKSGKLELAFKHYKQALKLDPRHRGAHEYIGEAYLMARDLASAEKHLAALRQICLLPCEELGDLEREIKAYRAKSATAGSR